MQDSPIKIKQIELFHGIIWENLQLKGQIASGAFGTVYCYKDISNDNLYAVKTIPDNGVDLENEKIFKELEFYKRIDKINNSDLYFPKFFGFVNYKEKISKNSNSQRYFCFIFELFDCSLRDIIRKKLGKRLKKSKKSQENVDTSQILISYEDFKSLVKSLIMGFALLQQEKLAHRDIKPDNIVYKEINIDQQISKVFKIIDLGEGKAQNNELENTIRGTLKYFSPESNYYHSKDLESVEAKELNPIKSDVYSFGLVIIYALFGDLPFTDRDKEADFNPHEFDVGPYDKDIEKYIKVIEKEFENLDNIQLYCKILRKCMRYNPEKRPDFIKLKKYILKIDETFDFLNNGQDLNHRIIQLKDQNNLLEKDIFTKNLEINELKVNYENIYKELEELKKENIKLLKENEDLKKNNNQIKEEEKKNEIEIKKIKTNELIEIQPKTKDKLKNIEFFENLNQILEIYYIDKNFQEIHFKPNPRCSPYFSFYKSIQDFDVFPKFKNLKILDVDLLNQLEEPHIIIKFIESISQTISLEEFNLRIANDKAFVSEFGNDRNERMLILEEISKDIVWPKMTEEDLNHILEYISLLSNLKILNLNISHIYINSLADCLSNLMPLQSLKLFSLTISKKCICFLNEANLFEESIQLNKLFEYNEFTNSEMMDCTNFLKIVFPNTNCEIKYN